MWGFSAVSSILLLASGSMAAVQIQSDCKNLRTAVSTYSKGTASSGLDKSITTFESLLHMFGFDNTVISMFGSSNLLVPTDRAFINFMAEVGGPEVDPMAFVMSHPNAFKQIILYHFTGPMKNAAGEAHTALAAMDRLGTIIDKSAICGREDSRYVKIQFKQNNGQISLTEPVAKHYDATTVNNICNTDQFMVNTIDEVLTPCPHSMMFPGAGDPPGEHGCSTIAAAAAKLGAKNHPFGVLPYQQGSSPVVANLKHPNILASSTVAFTVFVPTLEALQAAGLTETNFTSVPGALDNVVKGHIAEQEVCIGGQVPATPIPTLAGQDFCDSDSTLTVTATSPSALSVSSGTGMKAATSGPTNIKVCGGLVHVVDSALLPCSIDEYGQSVSREAGGPAAASRATNTQQVAGEASSALHVTASAAVLLLASLVMLL